MGVLFYSILTSFLINLNSYGIDAQNVLLNDTYCENRIQCLLKDFDSRICLNNE